jgi:DNA-binding beta-propeller fold protein YncE
MGAGAFGQAAVPDGCYRELGGGGCRTAHGLKEPNAVAASPDGKNLYVASPDGDGSGAVAIFNRDPVTGAVSHPAPTASCIGEGNSYDGTPRGCAEGIGLLGAKVLAVSPDGRFVYVAGDGYGDRATGCCYAMSAIAILHRDLTTGALTQAASPEGCVTIDQGLQAAGGDGGQNPKCAPTARHMGAPGSMVISPDGDYLYLANPDERNYWAGGSLLVFKRDKDTGALTQLAGNGGKDGCLQTNQTKTYADCAQTRAFYEPKGLALSPDAKQLYVAASEGNTNDHDGAVAIFDRSADSGVLTQKEGAAGCISPSASDGFGPDTCRPGKALHDANTLVASADGKNVYLAGQGTQPDGGPYNLPIGAVSVFSRDASNGELAQLAGVDGCVSNDTTNGQWNGGPERVCSEGRGMNEPTGITESSDGKFIYVASGDAPGDGVAIFGRDAANNGALVQLGGRDGCLTRGGFDSDGTEQCRSVDGVEGAGSLISLGASSLPGCANLYVTGAELNTLAMFSRQPECTPPPGPAPGATTGDGTGVTSSSVVLHGVVDPNGVQTGYRFQFGQTTSYGAETLAQELAPTPNGIAVIVPLTGLQDGVKYHYRLIAGNANGGAQGADKTFTTLPKKRVLPLGVTLNAAASSASRRASISVSKGRHGYVFSGRVRLPKGVTRQAGCKGTVSIRVRALKQTISNRRALLRSNCTYRKSVTFQIPKRFFSATTIQVRAFFAGNDALKPRASAVKDVQVH